MFPKLHFSSLATALALFAAVPLSAQSVVRGSVSLGLTSGPKTTYYIGSATGGGSPLSGFNLGNFQSTDVLSISTIRIISEDGGGCDIVKAFGDVTVRPVAVANPTNTVGSSGTPTSPCPSYPCTGGQEESAVGTSGTIAMSNYDGLGVVQLTFTVSAFVGVPGGCTSTIPTLTATAFFTVGAAPLPVELTRLSAKPEGTRNAISWSAASERDLATYTVERAEAAAPEHFAPVASVAPRGTSTGVEAIYTAYDDAPARVSYYRLKAVDLDGSVDYSAVVAVTRTSGAPGIKVYPNPSRAGASASIALAGVDEVVGVNVTISDAAGRQVAQVRYTTDGNHVLPVGGLPVGLYTVSAVTGVSVQTDRLVIE